MTTSEEPAGPQGERRSLDESSAAAPPGRPLGAQDFILLNDEIRAFVLAGIPLEVGLEGTASRTDGILSQVASDIASRLQQGETLEQAIESRGQVFPPEYRAILAAGIRTGQLPAVLTSLSEVGESVGRLKSRLRLAMIYPLAVFCLAYSLFVGLMMYVIPRFQRTFASFRTEETPYFHLLTRISETVGVWGVAVPVVLLGLWLLSWLTSWLTGSSRSSIDRLRFLPGARDMGLARLSHVMSLLVEHQVPLPEAMRLSGEASGSGHISAASTGIASRIESGHSLRSSLSETGGLPAFLQWLMVVGEQQGALGKTLKQAANIYEQRALVRFDWFRRIVPPVTVLFFGGLITLFYALTVFVPLTELLKSLEGATR